MLSYSRIYGFILKQYKGVEASQYLFENSSLQNARETEHLLAFLSLQTLWSEQKSATFSVKGQRGNVLGLRAQLLPSQLLKPARTVQKQPLIICKLLRAYVPIKLYLWTMKLEFYIISLIIRYSSLNCFNHLQSWRPQLRETMCQARFDPRATVSNPRSPVCLRLACDLIPTPRMF